MPHHRVEAIANAFIRLARKEGRTLTNMQLQKLPYIAHGWGLVIVGGNLLDDVPQAWPYGPVYPRLYESLRRYGSGKVTDLIHQDDASPFCESEQDRGDIVEAALTPEETKLVQTVWDAYKGYTGQRLSALTHQPDSPWTITTRDKQAYAEIDNELIREHFQKLAERRRSAA